MFTAARPASQHLTPELPTCEQVLRQADQSQNKILEDEKRLIEAIICAVDRLAIDAATILSGINTFRSPDATITGTDLSKFLPVDEKQLLFMLLAFSDNRAGLPSLKETESFLAKVRDGRTALHHFMVDEETIGCAHARTLNAQPLSMIWKSICSSAITLVEESDENLRRQLPVEYQQNSAVLLSLLTGAINGFSSCLNAKGELYTPELPQQRQWPRHSVLQNCTVNYDGRSFDAFVIDASAGGLGLENIPELPVDGKVTVTLECGRMLNGLVAWSNGGRVGLRFTVPLMLSDPLLTG